MVEEASKEERKVRLAREGGISDAEKGRQSKHGSKVDEEGEQSVEASLGADIMDGGGE